VLTQNSSFTNGNLERQEGRYRCVCLQNFLPFCQYIYLICWMAASSALTLKYKGAVINKVFDSGKARLDLTQGMWQQLHWGVWIQSCLFNLPRNRLWHWGLYYCYCMEWTGSYSLLPCVTTGSPAVMSPFILLFNFQLWRFLLSQLFNCHPAMIVITVQVILVVYPMTLSNSHIWYGTKHAFFSIPKYSEMINKVD